jgi:hypothetical protein
MKHVYTYFFHKSLLQQAFERWSEFNKFYIKSFWDVPEFTIVKYTDDGVGDTVSFPLCPTFDTDSDPEIIRSVDFPSRFVNHEPGLVLHNKWEIVGGGYEGFDMLGAVKWSNKWQSAFDRFNIPCNSCIELKSIWENKLRMAGLH